MQRGSFILPRLVTLALLLSCSAFAASSDWKFEPHSEFELDTTGYPTPVPPTNQILETGQLSLPMDFRYQDNLKIRLAPTFQADPLNNSISERYWAELPEGYVQVQNQGWTVQAGFNVFTWGVTDGFNPLDVVSARREQDPLRPQKLGAASLDVKKDFANFTFEGIFIPRQRQTILPGIDSRWLPRQTIRNQQFNYLGESGIINLPPNLNYDYLPFYEKDNALFNNYGFRVQGQGLIDGLDASAEYFEGASQVPAAMIYASATATMVFPTYILNLAPNVQLMPVYYRERVFGGSLVYANFGSIFRFESAVTRLISQGAELPGDSEAYVLGVEHPFAVGPDSLTLLVQLTYQRQSIPIQSATTDLSRVFDRAGMVGLRYAFTEKLTALASALYDEESNGEYAHLEGSYALMDAVKLGLAGDEFWGAEATPFGTFNNNERIIGSIKTTF